MKFNYIHYQDYKTNKTFVVTIACTEREYAFAIQSLSDNHCKKDGRKLAERRYLEGNSIKFNADMTWKEIKGHFDQIRKQNRYWYFDVGPDKESKKFTHTFEFPTHLDKAYKLLSKQERIAEGLEFIKQFHEEDLK